MDRLDLVRRMIELGSDTLVASLHERLCADRLARASAGRVPAGSRASPTWEELAGQAVGEQVLTAEEAECLTACSDAPRSLASGHAASAEGSRMGRESTSPEEQAA